MNEVLIDKLFKQIEEAHKAGNYLKEKKAYEKLYNLYKCELGRKNEFTLDVLENLGNSYYNLGVYNKALQLYEEVYITRKKSPKEKYPKTLSALNNLAITYGKLGNYKKELELQNEVYSVKKDILGEYALDTLTTLGNIAVSYNHLGNYKKSLDLFKIIYIKLKNKLGEKHPDTLRALDNLAASYNRMGDYNKALELGNDVYIKRKNKLGEKHPDTLKALNNLARYYSHIGDYNKALELGNEAYIKRKNILGENHPDTLDSLFSLGGYYSDLGNYKKTSELQEEVYVARKRILGEKHPDTLNALSNLVALYYEQGDYNKALENINRVYNASKEILGEKHPDTLGALENLAFSYRNSGDYNKGFELQEKVYVARKKILGEKHPETLNALANLAISYFYLGNYKKMLELQNIVYNLKKEILGENHPETLSALANLANAYSNLGDYNTALEMTNAVYNARKVILGEKHPHVLSILNSLAVSYSNLGNYNKALKIESFVYSTSKEILGESHPDTLFSLNNLAFSYKTLKYYDKALDFAIDAYKKTKNAFGNNHLYTLFTLITLISIQINKEETDSQSIKKYMTTYFENINKLKATAFSIKEISSRRNFLKSFNEVYKLLKSSIFEKNIHDLSDYLFINKNLSFEIDIDRFHNEAMGERLSLEEVSHAIGNQLLIDFYELEDSRYGLILVKHEKYSQYVTDYKDIINGSFINDEDIQSFISSLDDYDHIYICPDGELYNVSFERVLNCSNISYLSSVQTLFKKNTDDDSNDQLVSFVYPDFSGRLSDDNDRGDKKGILYGSYLEGMFIHDIYGEKSTVYSSYEANHNNFLNTKKPRILHVSTHGDYLDNEDMEPMDRGILCLSGYNAEENNSGYISAREIQYMDLKGTELAVLSACNTALGENISGEGIYGIRRAFELAGCQTLLLTVEEVDDFNSAIFMKSFYERYSETNNIYQSFKDTKEYLKEYGLVELKELRDVFEKEMKNEINSHMVYTRNLNELNRRIEESEKREQIVRKKNGEYVVEDWNGFIIQGKIEN